MKKKFNPELLKEELRKFRLLSEYSFYTGEDDSAKPIEEEDDLEPVGDDSEAADSVAADLGVDGENPGETTGEIGSDDMENMGSEPLDGEVPPAEPAAPAPAPQPATDDVEVDVTSLVKGSEEAKQAADTASQNTSLLLKKFSELEHRVASMDSLSVKIDALEKEVVKRNPTPVEKLEMRSLSSFPYSLKLTDYWNEKEGPYDVTGEGAKKKEYVLTKNDVDHGYSDSQVKQSFNVKPEDINSFEEEDI